MSAQEDGKPPPDRGGGSPDSSSRGSGTHPQHTTSPNDDQPATYQYSLVERREDNAPEGHTSTLAELAARLRRHGNTYENKNGPGFLPATFENGRRANEDVECVHWLALDIEDTAGTVDRLQGPLTGYQRIVYSTWSHGDPAKWVEGEPRFRVLIPLETPVDPETYRALWQHVYKLLNGAPDAGCKDPARLMYTPRRRNPEATIAPWLELHEDGPALAPEALPAGDGETVSVDRLVAQQKARRGGDEAAFDPPKSLEDAPWIADALEHIDPDLEYPTWMRIGTALKTAFGNEAFELFDAWSAEGNKYDGRLGCRGEWNNFPDDRPENVPGGGVTIRTIWHLAKEYGWTPPADAYQSWHRPAPLDPYEGSDPLDLEGARAKVRDTVGTFLERDEGRLYVQAEPGAGKTYSSLDGVLEAWQRGESVVYVTSTNDVLGEKHEELLEKARDRFDSTRFNAFRESVQIEPKRTANNCDRFDVYNAFNRTVEGGGHEFCQNCDLRPENFDDPSKGCQFILDKWDAQSADPDVVLTTHAMETRKRGRPTHKDPDRDCVTCWRAILDAFLDAQGDLDGVPTRFEGYVDETDKQHRMKVRPAKGGVEPPELNEGNEYRLNEDGRPTPTASGKRRIRQWLADAAPHPIGVEPSDDVLFRCYRATSTASEYDVMVVDESILDDMLETVTVTFEDVAQWHENDDLDGPEGWLEDVNGAFGDGECADPTAVADRMPNNLEHLGNETGASILADALEAEAGDRGRREAVEDAPDWRALELLEYWSKNDWTGCVIREDNETGAVDLALTDARRLDLDRADKTLVLDGTGDPVAAEAILGADHEYIPVTVERPEAVTVQRVDWQLGRWSLSELDTKRHRALVEHPEMSSNTHLHVTRKDYNPNVDLEERSPKAKADVKAKREQHVTELRESSHSNDQIIHVGGTQSRGSNEYRDAESVSLASFYVPDAAIRQRAAMLHRLTRNDLEDCERAAVWQKDAAPTVQAAHRARFLEGATTVTYCDSRELPGLNPNRVIERDELDIMAATTTGHLRQWEGDHVAAHLLRDLVEQANGPVFANTPRGKGGISRYTISSHIGSLCESMVQCEIPEVKAVIRSAFVNRWDESWDKAVDAAGLHLARLKTPDGGKGKVVLSTDPIDAEAVNALVRKAAPAWRWYAYDDERVYLDGTAAKLRDALAELVVPEFCEWPAKKKREAVAQRLDVSASTVYRRMRDVGWTTEDLDEAWRDHHQDLEPSPPNFDPDPEFSEAVEERAAIMEYHGELDRDEANRRAPQATEPPPLETDPPWDATPLGDGGAEAGDLRPLDMGESWGTAEVVCAETVRAELEARRRHAGYRVHIDESRNGESP